MKIYFQTEPRERCDRLWIAEVHTIFQAWLAYCGTRENEVRRRKRLPGRVLSEQLP